MSYENSVCWYHGKLSRDMAEDILLTGIFYIHKNLIFMNIVIIYLY